jgi:hypothetical protein
MYAKHELTVSKPVGEEQVEPTTRFRDRREGVEEFAEMEEEVAAARSLKIRERIGDRDMRFMKGEFDGVSLRRLDGVDAILLPLENEKRSL